jgi:hypothetical protein
MPPPMMAIFSVVPDTILTVIPWLDPGVHENFQHPWKRKVARWIAL